MDEQRQSPQAENTENVESAEKTEEAVSTKKRWKWNVPLLILEFFVLLIAIGVLYVITTTTR